MYAKRTPCVRHFNFHGAAGEARHHLILEAMRKLRIKDEAQRLMLCYVNCASGFKPSTRYIHDKTGIAENNIARARAKLARFGLLCFRDDTIWIDWDRIRLLASLDEHLMGSPRKAFIAPMEPPKAKRKLRRKTDLELIMEFQDCFPTSA